MNNYQRILLATDLSERSVDIAARAAGLARALDARLDLAHVLEHVPENFPADIVPTEDLDKLDVMKNRAHEKLTQIAERLDLQNANLLIGVGAAKDEILRIARGQEADLLVVGSHERHGLALLRGSVTDRVVHGAFCDVLAMHLTS